MTAASKLRPASARAALVAALTAVPLAAAIRTSAMQTPATRVSLSNGAYTAAQEKRGAALYSRECSTCHGETLEGGEGSPPLAGPAFRTSYGGQTIAVLFDKIRTTMPAPPEQPGKLSLPETADVVAHILRVNGFPAGDTPLSTNAEELKRLVLPPP